MVAIESEGMGMDSTHCSGIPRGTRGWMGMRAAESSQPISTQVFDSELKWAQVFHVVREDGYVGLHLICSLCKVCKERDEIMLKFDFTSLLVLLTLQ